MYLGGGSTLNDSNVNEAPHLQICYTLKGADVDVTLVIPDLYLV